MEYCRAVKKKIVKNLKRIRHVKTKSKRNTPTPIADELPRSIPHVTSFYEIFHHQEMLRRRQPDPFQLIRSKIVLSEKLTSSVEEEELEKTILKEQHEHLTYYTACLRKRIQAIRGQKVKVMERQKLETPISTEL